MSDIENAPSLSVGSGSQLPERIAIAIFLLTLLVVLGGNIYSIFDTYNFHEELRILYHLDPARTNSKDYAGQFLSQFPQPFLYSYLTKAALSAGVDLITFHRLLGVFCGLLLLAGVALSGWRVRGMLAAVVVTVFIAAQPFYHYQLSSATPHAFAFPLLIWALVCLLYDRLNLLAGLTVLSGLLYPPMSPVLGLILAWHFVVTRNGLSGNNPDRIANVLVIGITAAISLALLWHQLAPVEGYGATLMPGEKVDIYPENGPNGRHFYGVFHPLSYVFVSAMGQLHEALPVSVIILVPICIAAIAGLGLYYLRDKTEFFQPILSFIIPSVVFCVFVTLLRPYVAYRFLLYPILTILPLLFVYGLFTLCYSHRSTLRYPAAVIVIVMAPLIFAVSDANGHRSFLPLRLDEQSSELMDYLQQLPADSLIAAWPGQKETSLIPYVAGRPLLVNYKAHYPTYEGHIANMRTRMFDLIDAYLAQDPQPLINLRCRWRADYLVIDRILFSGDGVMFKYFEPFDTRIKEVLAAADKSKMILRQPPPDAVVFKAGRYSVLDLAVLSRDTSCPARDEL
jgi:hypothetical protein